MRVRRGTRLAEAVALLDGHFEPLVKGVDNLARQGCGTRVHHAQGGEVVFVDDGVFAQEQHHGRDDV